MHTSLREVMGGGGQSHEVMTEVGDWRDKAHFWRVCNSTNSSWGPFEQSPYCTSSLWWWYYLTSHSQSLSNWKTIGGSTCSASILLFHFSSQTLASMSKSYLSLLEEVGRWHHTQIYKVASPVSQLASWRYCSSPRGQPHSNKMAIETCSEYLPWKG